MNSNVNYGLRVALLRQCRFIRHKYTTLVRNTESGGAYAYVKAVRIWEISVTSVQICCELKTALKIKEIITNDKEVKSQRRHNNAK